MGTEHLEPTYDKQVFTLWQSSSLTNSLQIDSSLDKYFLLFHGINIVYPRHAPKWARLFFCHFFDVIQGHTAQPRHTVVARRGSMANFADSAQRGEAANARYDRDSGHHNW